MKDIIQFLKWLLEKDIPARNATSFFVGLLSVVLFHFASRRTHWFQDLEGYGAVGVGTSLLIVFLMAFLATSLVYCRVTTYRQQVASREKAQERVEQQKKAIRDNLESLTDWQREFLLRFIVENRRQISDYQVGKFRAVWGPEMSVLVKKRIVKEHRRDGVYEIEPVYLEYLRANWNPETGTLG